MTAALCRTAMPSTLAPVLTTLAMMRDRHGDKVVAGIAPGVLVTDPTGWLPATALLDSDTVLDDLLDAAKQRWQAHDHVAASLAWKAYTRWLALPAVLGYAVARRVPDVSPDNVLFRYSASTKHLITIGLREPRVAGLVTTAAPADRFVADEVAMQAELRGSLVDLHLAPLMERVRSRVHIGRRSLWGSLANGVAQMVSRAAEALPVSALATAEAVLSTLDIVDLVSVTPVPGGTLDVHRRTCCLSFTLPDPKFCSGCVVRGAGGVGE